MGSNTYGSREINDAPSPQNQIRLPPVNQRTEKHPEVHVLPLKPWQLGQRHTLIVAPSCALN